MRINSIPDSQTTPSKVIQRGTTPELKDCPLGSQGAMRSKQSGRGLRLARRRFLPKRRIPRCLEDPPFGIHRLLTHVEKAEVVGLAVKSININSSCAFFAHPKAMNVVAGRGKRVYPPVGHRFATGLP
jgi:hypothetical protein